ncbi:heparinase II/III family protein [Streptomyces filamentosus]
MPLSRRAVVQAALAALAAAPLVTALGSFEAAAAQPTTEIPDAAFFGAWNAAAGTWSTPPAFDYAANRALVPVADAARAGDYATARKALLQYMRNRPERTPPAFANFGNFTPSMVPLVLDHVWTLGRGEIYQTTLTVGPDWTAVDTDVTASVQNAAASGGVGFMLMARHKESATAEFASRHTASGAPVLTLTYPDGSVRTVAASQSCYIAAGPDAATTYGSAPSLQVHDEGTGAVSASTRKGYLWFDLAGLTAPARATLALTGRTSGSRQQVMLYQDQVSFDETKRCWNNTLQNTLSWQGDPGGFDWKQPTGGTFDREFGWGHCRFYFAGPVTDAYRESKDETIAAGLIGLMTDFVDDANGYTMGGSPAGAASFPRNLDSAWRYQNWCYAYETLRTSPSLTPDANTSLLKAMHAAGVFFSVTTSNTPNWMVSIKSSLIYIGAYFPEFAAATQWRDGAVAYLGKQLAEALYPDGGYVEASATYAMGVAQGLLGSARALAANGYPVGSISQLQGLAWFLADQTYPNGDNPAYGDSSLATWRPSLSQLAELFQDDELVYAATGGAAGTAPKHTSAVYPDTRVVVQRTGWTDTDWYLRLNADFGNHGHPDELAVQVYAHDRALLPAMGAYSYADDPKANWLRKSTESRTTVTIDGRAQNPSAEGAVENVSTPWVDLARGFTDGTPGVRHSRSVLFLHGVGWLVSDTLDPSDSARHSYQQNWHLLPDAAPTLDGAVARTHFASGTQLTVIPADPAAVTATVKDGYYSQVLYQVAPTRYLSYTLTAAGRVDLDTLLLPVPPGSDATATATLEEASAGARTVRLTATAGDLEGYFFRAPDDRVARRFGPYRFDGPLAYVDRHEGVRRLLLTGGTALRQGAQTVLAADRPLTSTLAVRLNPRRGTVEVTGPAAEAGGRALHLRAPWARSATVAGEPVHLRKTRGMVTLRALK